MLQLAVTSFKANTYLVVEGTPNVDRFFIIQQGQVICKQGAAAVNSSKRLGPGDFIGVIPCMAGRSQMESVIALTDGTAIAVRRDQYPELIMRNTPVAMKIIRTFANNMREVNEELSRIALGRTVVDTAENIIGVAEFYDNEGMTDIATYAYYQYLKECPQGPSIELAKKRFIALKPRSKAVYYEPNNDLVRSYPQGTMIMAEHQRGQDMFIIQEGVVRITKVVDGAEVTLALLQKGDMFGEMALLEDKPRSASAIANEDCRLMTVNRANFLQMVSTQPQMISRLTTTLAERLWSMNRQLINTKITDPVEKLIDMLALQLEKLKRDFTAADVYQSDYSTTDLANMCSIPDHYKARAMIQFESDRHVKISGGKICVRDIPDLIEQAAFYRKRVEKKAAAVQQ